MIEYFKNILDSYHEVITENIAKHPKVKIVTEVLPALIFHTLIDKDRYLVKGSVGQGNWSVSPWIAVFDILVTRSAQDGYYPVFLFKEDMTGFYLSLNQGVTKIREIYKRGTQEVLRMKAGDYRAQLNVDSTYFSEAPITLRKNNRSGSSLLKLYEAGNIISKFYSGTSLPNDEQLKQDLLAILKLYDVLSYNEGLPNLSTERESDEQFIGYEDLKKIRLHKRIERNIQLSKKVKKVQGYTCKACKFNFRTVYGDLGENFIEAHHIRPISKLVGQKLRLDVRTDFIVLCSNCHSMIHRLEDPSDLKKLKSILKVQGDK